MNDDVTWREPQIEADANTPEEAAQGSATPVASPPRPPVRHGQILVGVSAIVAAVAFVLHLTTSIFESPLAVPLMVLGIGVFVLVYGLAALRSGRPTGPGEEERRERKALARITKQEQRCARRAARRS